MMLPQWTAYTRGFPLGINDIVMRTKDWVEIRPLDPDQDVVSQPFFKIGKGGATSFKSGRCIINFHIPNDVYGEYLEYADRNEEGRLETPSPSRKVQVRRNL
jgi:hypothetical protein